MTYQNVCVYTCVSYRNVRVQRWRQKIWGRKCPRSSWQLISWCDIPSYKKGLALHTIFIVRCQWLSRRMMTTQAMTYDIWYRWYVSYISWHRVCIIMVYHDSELCQYDHYDPRASKYSEDVWFPITHVQTQSAPVAAAFWWEQHTQAHTQLAPISRGLSASGTHTQHTHNTHTTHTTHTHVSMCHDIKA